VTSAPIVSVDVEKILSSNQYTWLVTGAAGFIGSNLCEFLVRQNQRVVGLDNLATGHLHNVEDVKKIAAELGRTKNFSFQTGDITEPSTCDAVVTNVDFVLHQAALGSVPRSLKTPLVTHKANVDGFVCMLNASASAGVKRFVYASSSSVYGDSGELPKVESRTGSLLSPYAATKAVNELYADVFQRCYGIECVGLRYFNVFGKRQDPNGPYAAVIPKWLLALLHNQPLVVNGDGSTSRDFCYIDNVVQANVKAALRTESLDRSSVVNVAYGEQTSLLELAEMLRNGLAMAKGVPTADLQSLIEHRDFRAGDVRHSLANILQAKELFGYMPTHSLSEGLIDTCRWYLKNQERLL
jgi:UDP-N-acetylglucosamine/UDP-N-acetylgalactosamine 4-epimerase